MNTIEGLAFASSQGEVGNASLILKNPQSWPDVPGREKKCQPVVKEQSQRTKNGLSEMAGAKTRIVVGL